jgi:hypothetical protein
VVVVAAAALGAWEEKVKARDDLRRAGDGLVRGKPGVGAGAR